MKKWLYRTGLIIGGGIFCFKIIQSLQALFNQTIVISQPSSILLATILALGARILQMTAWRSLILGIGISLSWRGLFENYTLTFLPRYIPGSVWGYLSRTEWLVKDYGISRSLSNFTSILEVLLILESIAIITILHFALLMPLVPKLILFFLICILPWLSWKLFYTLSKIKPIINIFTFLHLKENDIRKIPFNAWATTLLLHTITWFIFGYSLQALTNSVGGSNTYPVEIFNIIFAISWLIGFVILFIPTGLGVREQLIATYLTDQTNLQPNASALVSIFSRIVILLGELIMLFFGMVIYYHRKKGK